MTKHVEIHPGYGMPGIEAARDQLVHDVIEAIRVARIVSAEKVFSTYDRGAPCIRIEFDAHTKLYLTFWPHGAGGGYDPTWHGSVSVTASLLAVTASRPLNWWSEMELIVAASQQVLVNVKLAGPP